MYLTYDEYKAFGGTLSPAAFENLEFKARKRIDFLTANRVRDNMAEVSEAVKRCVYSLINTESSVGIEAQANRPNVTSFSTDGYSETYGNAISSSDAGKSMNDLACEMLHGETDDNGTPLLFRGVRG